MKRCTKCGKELSDDALFCPRCGTKQVPGTALVGTMVADRYLVQGEIGRGGSGTVYRARHVALGTHVAIKVLHPSLSGDEAAMERFRKEAVTVASIDNEHVVHVFDFGRLSDGRFYMVMELLDGQTLDQLFEEGLPLAVDRAIDITSQAAEALAEVHAIGFVHRDLRPRNLFLARRKGREDFVKILDFGMSKLLSPGMSPQATLGVRFSDPIYIAPEQIRGEPVDRRTDVYSLAVLLYQMLTGRPPFSGAGAVAVLDQQLEKMPPVPSSLRPGLSPLLDAALLKALAKNRETRFDTMIEFRDALRKAHDLGPDRPPGRDVPTISSERRGERHGDVGGDAAPGSLPIDIAPDKTVIGLGGPVPPPAARDVASKTSSPRPGEPGSPGGGAGKQALSGPEPARERTDVGRGPVSGSRGGGREKGGALSGVEDEEVGPARVEDTGMGAGSRSVVESMGSAKGSVPDGSEEDIGMGSDDSEHMDQSGPDSSDATESGREGDRRDARAEDEDPGRSATSQGGAGTGAGAVGEAQDPTMSQLWYAEGEEAQKALAALAAGEQESQTTLPAMYRQMDTARHGASGKMLLWVTVAALAVVAALVGFLAWTYRSREGGEAGGREAVAAATSARDAAAGVDAGTAGKSVDAGTAQGKDAAVGKAKDAAILSLPADELVVPGVRKARGHSGRHLGGLARQESRARHSHARTRPTDGGRLPRLPEEGVRPESGETSGSVSQEIAAGRSSLRRGDLAGAKKHFLKAKSLGGGARALAGLGEVAFEQGRYAEAVRLLKRASRSGSVHSLVLLGDAYFKSGNLRKAKAAYERALRKSPSNRAAKRNLEVVRRRLGESR